MGLRPKKPIINEEEIIENNIDEINKYIINPIFFIKINSPFVHKIKFINKKFFI